MGFLTVVGFALAFTAYSVAQTGPAIVVRPPASTVAWTGKTVRLTCVAYGDPLPSVTWMNPGGNILTDSSPSVKINTEMQTVNGKKYAVSTIQLCGLTTSMTGQYSCAATGGSSSSGITSNVASFFLQVSSTPDTDAAAVVVKPTTTNTVSEKGVVEFVCVAYGNPLPIITWSRSNIPNITSNTLANASVTTQTLVYGDVAFQKSVLQLCSVSRRDQDSAYVCKADNGVSGNGIAVNSATFGLTVSLLSTSSSTASSPSPSSESQTNVASETAYQVVVGFLVVIVVVLVVLIAITFVLLLLIHKKGREDVTLAPAPTLPQPASNPTFEDYDQDGPDDEEMDALKEFDDIDDDDKEDLVS